MSITQGHGVGQIRAPGGLDRWGITLSTACGVHCLTLPVLLALLPGLGSIAGSVWVHGMLSAVLVPLALTALYRGARRHGRYRGLWLGVLGLAVTLAVAIAEAGHEHGPGVVHWDALLTSLSGSAMLVTAHLLNLNDLRTVRAHACA